MSPRQWRRMSHSLTHSCALFQNNDLFTCLCFILLQTVSSVSAQTDLLQREIWINIVFDKRRKKIMNINSDYFLKGIISIIFFNAACTVFTIENMCKKMFQNIIKMLCHIHNLFLCGSSIPFPPDTSQKPLLCSSQGLPPLLVSKKPAGQRKIGIKNYSFAFPKRSRSHLEVSKSTSETLMCKIWHHNMISRKHADCILNNSWWPGTVWFDMKSVAVYHNGEFSSQQDQ